jgi:HEAT repeat protein
VVRAAVVYLLSSRRVGQAAHFRRRLDDLDHRVRIEAVRALVSVDDAEGVGAAQRDDNREVRIAVANALGTLGDGASAIRAPIPIRWCVPLH